MAFILLWRGKRMLMKKSQTIALTTLSTAVAAGLAIYFVNKHKHHKRRKFVANAGYEFAYDIHYPVKYGRGPKESDF